MKLLYFGLVFGNILLLGLFIISRYRLSYVDARVPHYCPEGIFIKDSNYDSLFNTLEKIKPFNSWTVKKTSIIANNTCADAGYLRPTISYIYTSGISGIKYEILFMLTIPVNKSTGRIGTPSQSDLVNLIMEASLSDEAIINSEKVNSLKDYHYGKIEAGHFPKIFYFISDQELEWHEFEKQAAFSYQYSKWENLPNPEYNSDVERIKAELQAHQRIGKTPLNFVIILFILLLAMLLVIIGVFKKIFKK